MSRLGRGFPASTQIIPSAIGESNDGFAVAVVDGGGLVTAIGLGQALGTAASIFGWSTSGEGSNAESINATVASTFHWSTFAHTRRRARIWRGISYGPMTYEEVWGDLPRIDYWEP